MVTGTFLHFGDERDRRAPEIETVGGRRRGSRSWGMAPTTARRTADPVAVLADAAGFLARDPVRHNVVVSLLESRVVHPEPGDYWIVERGGDVVGVVFRSPVDHYPLVTPMDLEAVTTVVGAMADVGVTLPGVNGDATTSARFAGAWTARTRTPGRPVHAQRLFEVPRVHAPLAPGGRARTATAADHGLLVDWVDAFHAEINDGPVGNARTIVERRVEAGLFHVWDHDGAVAFAGTTRPALGVVRIGPVYTPPACRGRGYASALVAELSQRVLDRGERCVLYTDLDNPTSNGIYRRIGYEPVDEAIRFAFGR
jgi:GNAT superfamily N-acetyltransferase